MAPKRGPGSSKRNPTVLVTDSRDQPQSRAGRRRRQPDTEPGPASRFVTVDNVLQYASDVPSMQQRRPAPGSGEEGEGGMPRYMPRRRIGAGSGTVDNSSSRGGSGRTARDLAASSGVRAGAGVGGAVGGSGRSGANPGLDSRLRAAGRLASLPHLPPRSTKVTEKLVLLPETVIEEDEGEEGEEDEEEEEEEEERARSAAEPFRIDEEQARKRVAAVEADEEALSRQAARAGDVEERSRRMAAQQRLGRRDFAVDNESAPLLAEEELRRRRKVAPEKAKSYAERLPKARRTEKLPRVTAYCTAQEYKMNATAAFVREYHGARTKLYDDCLYTAYHLPLLPGVGGYRIRSSPVVKSAAGKAVLDEEIERNEQRDYHEDYFAEEEEEHSVGARADDDQHRDQGSPRHRSPPPEERHDETFLRQDSPPRGVQGHGGESNGVNNGVGHKRPSSPSRRRGSIPPNALAFAEMFVFSYGVVVFWNFSERQEKEVLADLAFSSENAGTIPIATNPLAEEDFETEEFHFEYSAEISRPRIFNDMITLRSGDHMIKLAISHGIAQSTKLSLFEEAMARQMSEAKDVPKRLALTGHLGMKREEVFRILGKLFRSRVEVNLSSNMLDVPNFFWDSEPTLHPLYIALREYLEIKPRIQVLNERCRVFLDLTEILSDSIADNKMSRQTWIIIILIFISIVVTISEVILRFGLLSTRSSSESLAAPGPSRMIPFSENTKVLGI